MHKISASVFSSRKAFTDSFTFHFAYYNKKIDTVAKRGSMLENLITDRDKRKHWHFNILTHKPKCRNVFEGVHRPSRRQSVLNSVLIKNITDVISTGDIVPEILGYGIEITGVKVSPCCRILNVFWQVPPSCADSCEDLGQLLTFAGPKIRAELISRNVLGRVPHIFFLRDDTNAKIAAFEKALREVEKETGTESSLIPDDSFLDDLYSFKTPKDSTNKDEAAAPKENTNKITNAIPEKPPDMKSDVFGLNHEMMMQKVIALKGKYKKPVQHPAVIDPQIMNEDDLFSKIPGVCFHPDTTREDVLKKFHTERKIQAKKRCIKLTKDDYQTSEEDVGNVMDYYEPEENSYREDDFIEDNNPADNARY